MAVTLSSGSIHKRSKKDCKRIANPRNSLEKWGWVVGAHGAHMQDGKRQSVIKTTHLIGRSFLGIQIRNLGFSVNGAFDH